MDIEYEQARLRVIRGALSHIKSIMCAVVWVGTLIGTSVVTIRVLLLINQQAGQPCSVASQTINNLLSWFIFCFGLFWISAIGLYLHQMFGFSGLTIVMGLGCFAVLMAVFIVTFGGRCQ